MIMTLSLNTDWMLHCFIQTECYIALYCYIRLALLFNYYIIWINWSVSALNFFTKKVSHKNVTLILNTNRECYKIYFRLLQLYELKWIDWLNMFVTVTWRVMIYFWSMTLIWSMTLTLINDLRNQGHVTPKFNFTSWKHILLCSLCFPFPTTPNLCL